MKIIFVEPNLKIMSGHFFETTKSLVAYCVERQTNLQVGFVCNYSADEKILEYFPYIKPLYRMSCFERGKTDIAMDDIRKIITTFDLSEHDAIVFTTAHLREIRAVKKISKKSKIPKFVLQLHQYYPPLPDACMISDASINGKLENRYQKAMRGINQKKISIVVTPVALLATKIAKITGHRPKMFPVPFSAHTPFSNKKKNLFATNIGFFGDGRKEKGLLDFLRLVKIITKKYNNAKRYHFIVNVQNPRGFAKKETFEIGELLKDMGQDGSIEIIWGHLDTDEYHHQLYKCSLAILLHHPRHYSIRLSGIAVECGMMGVPVLVHKGTSMAKWVKEGRLFGAIMRSNRSSDIIRAITELGKATDSTKNKTKLNELSVQWTEEYSAKSYIDKYLLPLLSHE